MSFSKDSERANSGIIIGLAVKLILLATPLGFIYLFWPFPLFGKTTAVFAVVALLIWIIEFELSLITSWLTSKILKWGK